MVMTAGANREEPLPKHRSSEQTDQVKSPDEDLLKVFTGTVKPPSVASARPVHRKKVKPKRKLSRPAEPRNEYAKDDDDETTIAPKLMSASLA